MNAEEKNIENLLYGYFAGELKDDGQKELLQWLESDDVHKKQLAELSDWWAIAHVSSFSSHRKADFNSYFGHLTTSAVIPIRKKLFWGWNIWAKIAASALLLLSVGTASYYIGRESQVPEEALLGYFETTTPYGAQTKIVLPDQSVVWVNAGSTLRYGNDFNKQDREIQLVGEAYFEVAHDTLKPFVVKSDNLFIKVLGTRFNVKAYPADEVTDVTLVEGKVNIGLHDRNAHTGEVVLSPDRMLSYDKHTNRVKVSEVHAADAVAWMDGGVRFADLSFEQIARDLERKYNVRIRIESEELKKEVFTGSFTKEYALDDVLREVDVDRKFTWEYSGGVWVIRNK